MSEINVISKSQRIIVDPVSASVSVINMGPQGVQGVPGQVSNAQLTSGLATKVDRDVGNTITLITKVTQAQYNALSPPVATTLYVIVG